MYIFFYLALTSRHPIPRKFAELFEHLSVKPNFVKITRLFWCICRTHNGTYNRYLSIFRPSKHFVWVITNPAWRPCCFCWAIELLHGNGFTQWQRWVEFCLHTSGERSDLTLKRLRHFFKTISYFLMLYTICAISYVWNWSLQWMFNQHRGCWWPVALAPGHQ